MRRQFEGNRFAEYCDAFGVGYCLDVHKGTRNKDIIYDKRSGQVEIKANVDLGSMQTLDFASWLPFAAKEYEVSADILDYILLPVITMPSNLPNRNGVGFPAAELSRFNVEQGRLAFKTFAGKPIFVEHFNKDPKKSRGIIADASLRKMEGYGGGKVWKLMELLAVDRSKDPQLASSVLSGEANAWSMGAWVDGYTCSYCNAELGACSHLHPREARDFYILNGKLVCRLVKGVCGMETSSVAIPAFTTAINTRMFGYDGLDKRV